MSILLYSLKTRSINWRTWASSVRDATTASTRAPAWRRLFSSLFHVALCARTNRERGAVLCEYFCDGLPHLSVAGLRLSPGQLFLQEWPAWSYPSHPVSRCPSHLIT